MLGRNKSNVLIWECRCDCGNIKIATKRDLVNTNLRSCGCVSGAGMFLKKHGLYNHKLYNIYYNILQRCYNPKVKSYKNYGAIGISIDETWKNDFVKFYNDVIGIYIDGYTIERIDVYKGYTISNIKFIPRSHQNRNKRNTVKVLLNGEYIPVRDLCETYGVKPNLIHSRLRLGWDIIDILNTPIKKIKNEKPI